MNALKYEEIKTQTVAAYATGSKASPALHYLCYLSGLIAITLPLGMLSQALCLPSLISFYNLRSMDMLFNITSQNAILEDSMLR